MKRRLISILIVIIVTSLSLNFGCSGEKGFNQQLDEVISDYRFSLVGWEFRILCEEFDNMFFGSHKVDVGDTSLVLEYFSLKSSLVNLANQKQPQVHDLKGTFFNETQQRIEELERIIDKIIERQIRNTLSELGIRNPLYDYVPISIGFPPVNFILEQPPCLLVVSPRDKIESSKEMMLIPDITSQDILKIERMVDQLGVSSIVVRLGGISTYPSFVSNKPHVDLVTTIEIAIEEWLHQYLFFRPLGFSYALDVSGINPNYQVAVLNEAAVGIISKEIATILIGKYYPDIELEDAREDTLDDGFDFNKAMREIRITVDELLSAGKISEAEEYMEQQRQYLYSEGYYIRKLNQAYFAFHGTYADEPTSVDPIGEELKTLRNKFDSVSEFLNLVANITNREDLLDYIEG